jgi:cellobiose phosphorylase
VKRDLDHYECRHGLGYTRITGARGGIRAELLFLVPLGASAEVHRVTLHNLLGIRPEHEGLRVSPCLPAEIPEFTVTRRCRGATSRMRFRNSGEGGRAGPIVDGQPIDGEVVPWAPPGAVVDVDCVV